MPSRFFKAAFGWFFGLFLLLGGLGLLMEGSIGPGLLVLLGATALLPPVVSKLLGGAEDMEQTSAWIKAGAVVAVYLAARLLCSTTYARLGVAATRAPVCR